MKKESVTCTVHFILFRVLRALTNIGQRITLTDLEEFFAAHRSLFFPPGLLRTFLEIEMENRLFIHVEGQIKEMNFSINLTKSSKAHSCDGRTAASVPREMSNCVRHYAPVTAESPLGLGVTVGTAVRFATAISPKDRHIR